MSAEVPVVDRFGLRADESIPCARAMLDPTVAQDTVQAAMEEMPCGPLRKIEVLRHKPARRALVSYEFERRVVLGKIRAKGLDEKTFQLVRELGRRGFDEHASDGISVPAALGRIKAWNMWLQAEVTGDSAEALLLAGNPSDLAIRIAAAAAKLHATTIVVEREHSREDELKILRGRFSEVTSQQPQLAPRVAAVLAACERCLRRLPARQARLIHRDFYPAQVLAAPGRVWLLDLDLCSMGEPALDIGNFVAHVIELSVRTHHDAAHWQTFENDFINAYMARAREVTLEEIASWTFVSLARHIWISTQFPERRALTERLLELCEERAANY